MGFFTKLLSMGEDKPLKNYQKVVEGINALEPLMEAKSDEELSHMTVELRERLDQGETLDDVLPEAFAAVREASKRTLGLRHFDVQLIGGMALHDGKIAEMKTGEGKTLVSTLAGYLNALPGNNVHIVTVNDYLAARDSQWMGQVYEFLGMKVGLLQNGMDPEEKIPQYQADVTYGTNSEFGFDYLRDNMVARADRRVQRGHSFAIVDEVDSILIDEARTPLIISGAGSQAPSSIRSSLLSFHRFGATWISRWMRQRRPSTPPKQALKRSNSSLASKTCMATLQVRCPIIFSRRSKRNSSFTVMSTMSFRMAK